MRITEPNYYRYYKRLGLFTKLATSYWETLPLPGEPNSYISCMATHASDPNLVLASTLYGQLFLSHDAGDSWRKVRQEFSEVRSLAWMPS